MWRSLALARVVAGRARGAPALLAIRAFGVLVAVTLVAGVSLYSTAMGDAMLRASLRRDTASAYLSISSLQRPLAPATYARLDRYNRYEAPQDLGLPLLGLHVHHYTVAAPVYRADARGRARGVMLDALTLHYYEGFKDEVRIVAGRLNAAAPAPGAPMPVAVSRSTARSLHLGVGDRLTYSLNGHALLARPMVVAAIYVPTNVNSLFWDLNAGAPAYRSIVMPRLDLFLSAAAGNPTFSPDYFWQYQPDIAALRLANAAALVDGVQRVGARLAVIAPGASMLTSLDQDVIGFESQYNLLPYILLILVAPIVALVLYAVAVTTALVLDRQSGEIVLLRSRGASTAQIATLYVIEGGALGLLAIALGPLLGLPLARLIGNASGFLTFGGGLPVDLRPTGQTYLLAGATALLCLLAGLIPALALARRSMISFKQEQARPGRRPLWQRLFLDVIVLAIALYGLFVLVRQGAVTAGAGVAAVAQDPMIGIAPLLFAVAITLLISRVLPRLATLGARLLGRLPSPPAHVALQSVARAPRQPLLLVQLATLTLTLGVFAATVAGVESSNLTDQQLYAAGAPLRLEEYLDRTHIKSRKPDLMPLSAHLTLPGVHAATPALRVESAGNATNTVGVGTTVNVLGIDPATAGSVMWFRPDFADQPFEVLLRTIARPGPDTLVSATFLKATGLHVGDPFDVTLTNGKTMHARVSAVVRYFPTLDPLENPFVVANLASLQRAGYSYGPNEVWLATDHNTATIDHIITLARDWPRQIIVYQGLTPRFSPRDAPLAAGIYGVVSVGFLIALALALLGFFAYAYLSLQRRLTEFAIVRALGLSAGQLRWLLLCEQLFLLGAAILGGISAGVLTTRLFLPYMPIAANTLPPFLVIMPWAAIAEFVLIVGLVFVLVLSAHVSMLLRLRLGRVLRLGDA